MSSNDQTVKATVYLQVQPEHYRYASTDDKETGNDITRAKVVGSTQNRSERPKGGTVEVKLTIEIPKSAFLPLRPQATIVVPESLTSANIVVEAQDANEVSACATN